MNKSFLQYSFLILLIIFGLLGCEEQKDQALEYFKEKPESSVSDLEKFGFDERATPKPTPKVVIPFDNERTRQESNPL